MAVELVNLATPLGASGPFQSLTMNTDTGTGWQIGFSVGTGASGVAENDLLLFVWSCERSNGPNPTITTNNLHPTSGRTLTITNTTSSGGTATDWVDFGYGVSGQQRQGSTTNTTNQRTALGIFGKYVAASDVLSGGILSFSGSFSINGLSGNNAWRFHSGLYCVRGIGSTTGTRDINALATLSRSTLFFCDMAGENYGGTNYPHGGQTDECVWIGPQTTTYNSTTVYGSGVSGFDSPTVLFFGAWRNSGADPVASPSPTRNYTGGGLGTNYTFASPMATFSSHNNGVFAASGTTFEGGNRRNNQSHYNVYMYRKFASFSDMDSGWNGTSSAPKAFGYDLDASANGPSCLAVIIPEAETATNTPLSVTDEATSLDTFDLVVSRSVPFTDKATGLETKASVVGLGLLEEADALETKDQTKVKNLPLTDEATGLDTKADNFGYALPFTDEAASLDTSQKGVAEVFAEEATGLEAFDKAISSLIADSAEAVETSLKSISDSFLESADAVETKDENFGYAVPFTDIAEALDSFGKVQGLGLLEEATADTDLDLPEKNFIEEASALETFTTTRIYFLPITESAATVGDPDPVKETPADNAVPFTEESTTKDTFVITRVFDLPVTDSAATVDDLAPDVQRAFTLEVTDSASPVETKDETLAWTRGFTDKASPVDLPTKQIETLFADSADALDEPDFDFGFSVDFTDEAKGLDTAVIPGPAATRNFTESASAAESLASGVKIGLSLDIICEGILEGKSPPQLLTKEEALAIIDVYNIALNALGVGTLSGVNDGSPQATILNDTFDSFKRQFLTDYSWNGAKKTVALSRLQDYNSTDVKPVGDRWAYAYVLPNDYLRVLRINGYERYNNTQQHLENAFEIEVVNYATSATETANKRCLLTEETSVNLEYIFEPTDDDLTTLLGSQTEHALGLSFAHYIARNFGKTPQEIAVLADEARRAITAAKGVDGQEKTQRLRPDLGLIESRYWWRG